MPAGQFTNTNTLRTLFNSKGLNDNDTFFLFDHYLYFEPYKNNSLFTGYMFPTGWSNHYLQVIPHFKLSFDNKTTFNCVMNKSRYQRIIASIWLANHFDPNTFNYTKPWTTNKNQQKFIDFFLLDLDNKDLPTQWVDYLDNSPNNYLKNTTNAEVFANCLYKNIFANSAVSIVLEPVSSELGCMITEKYINAVYAGTVPLVDGYLIGETLKKVGFEIFEDVINYSYQYETNPLIRVKKMLDDNIVLLQNCADVITKVHVQDRITANFNLVRESNKLGINVLYNLNSAENIEHYLELSTNNPTHIIKFINQFITHKINK
jgi:hypothetical protein